MGTFADDEDFIELDKSPSRFDSSEDGQDSTN